MNRRMEQLESQVPPDREPPATLPITEGSRASSHSSIDALPPSTLLTHHHPHRASSPPEDGEVTGLMTSEMSQLNCVKRFCVYIDILK